MSRLRTPLVLVERLKISLLIVAIILLMEWSEGSKHFAKTVPARALLFFLFLEVTRQVIRWLLETSPAAAARYDGIHDSLGQYTRNVSSTARFRIMRAFSLLLAIPVLGFFVDTLTDRCTGTWQCAAATPRILIESTPGFIRFAIFMAISLLQLGLLMWTMTKMGAWRVVLPGSLNVSFDDIWGQDRAVARIKEQVRLLENSDEVEAAGGKMDKGILLWGPPGTGKTMMAKAAATATTKPLILVPPGAFASTFVGVNIVKIHSFFRLIRKLALRHGGVLVFLDEIDNLGTRGAGVGEGDQPALPWESAASDCMGFDPTAPASPETSGSPTPSVVRAINHVVDAMYMGLGGQSGTLHSFLSGMDGMDTPRGLINRIRAFLNLAPIPVPRFRYLMMGATNQWQALDPALLRDGRFGTQVHVDYPSFEGRIATLKGYLDKIDHSVDEDQIIRVARSMHRASGASIEGAVNEAVLSVFRDPDRTDRVVTSDDLVRAMLWKSHGEPEGTQEMDEDNYRVAIHEAGHAIVLHVLYSGYSRILFGSIEGRRGNQGMIAHTEVAKRPIQPRSVMESRVAVGLASMVAEELVFGESTNGMGGDLRAATSLARQMVLTSGMGETLQVYATNGDEAHRFDQQVEEVLKGAKKLAHDVLIERRDQLEAVAQLLIAKGTVLGAEIEEVLT